MEYIEISEWDKFQHYKHRNPPWIKLYSYLLDNDEFDCLPDASKLLYFCLLLFASRRDNKIKLDFKWLQKKLPIEKPITKATIQPLIDNGFIICKQDASKEQAESKQNAIPEKRREETEKSKEEKKKYRDFVFLTEEEYEKLGDKWGLSVLDDKIDTLNDYIGSKGKKYKSHYHTILAWDRRNNSSQGNLTFAEKEDAAKKQIQKDRTERIMKQCSKS